MIKSISEIQAIILKDSNGEKISGINHLGYISILIPEGVVLTIDQLGNLIKCVKSEKSIPYTVQEVAEKLRYHPQYVRDLCRYGVIKAIKSGRKWLIPPANLKAYINK